MENEKEVVSKNFIEMEIDKDLAEGVYDTVCTRFPPEPNGYLHIGHAKSILLNYGLAKKYNGEFHMRFDDTNPTKEREEFVESIKKDIQWLGADWGDHLYFASNYFDQMYEAAITLIKKGRAYCSDLNADQIREYRGTLTEPGKEDPNAGRSIEENLQIFEDMKNGKYEDGSMVLRAKIDMTSPNINMRDPILYRVAHMHHHNTGDKWCIYPMYDFAHPIEDAIEGITHSICTLEFEDHRPLYDWVLREVGWWSQPPQQIEFARLNLTNTVMSKRYLKALVDDGVVDGWDDPRMPTIAGIRRRGYTPEAVRDFCEKIGVSKANSTVDISLLEHCVRDDLKEKVETRNVVFDPIKVIITNYPEGQSELCEVENNPQVPEMGTRRIPFSRELWV
ncbi:MAG: glutamine--tRNA ligase, partial [Roseburia lenta]|nr:glutamine--tRNA ligase [Roseburia lenta]